MAGLQPFLQNENVRKFLPYAPLALCGTLALAFISLFIPIISFRGGYNVTFFSNGEGVFLTVIYAATAAFAIVAYLKKFGWAFITAGVIGLVAAIVSLIDGFGNAKFGSAGPIILGIAGILMLVASIATILAIPPRQTGYQTSQQHSFGFGSQ
ncbi:MAG: hypothetical protein Q4C71_00120 [Microbacteriaceae bacterium]|nr:hypothetical protein [Microbacteriaceae bacterium]